jgi:uncharacterized protein
MAWGQGGRMNTGETRLSIPGVVGELAIATVVPPAATAAAVAVICHPDPRQGGTMDNKVVTTIAKSLCDVAVPSVRFNYRGVAGSAGEYAEGVGETEDCLAVIAWAEAQYPGRALWLMGFSFGGYVALRAANVSTYTPALLLTIAPAVTMRPFAELATPACPWLIIQGEEDEIIPPAAVYAWAQQLPANAQLQRMPGAGHFFHGQLIALRQQLQQWLSLHLPKNE